MQDRLVLSYEVGAGGGLMILKGNKFSFPSLEEEVGKVAIGC